MSTQQQDPGRPDRTQLYVWGAVTVVGSLITALPAIIEALR